MTTADGGGTQSARSIPSPTFVTSDALLAHWQGHRHLTRRVIEAFPDDALATFTIGSMRPFAGLAQELLRLAVPLVRSLVDGAAAPGPAAAPPDTKGEILHAWDASTEELDALWPTIPPGRFLERRLAFGQYEGLVRDHVLYVIDNEIHHRGQGYVYLRALGIEPPYFWERE